MRYRVAAVGKLKKGFAKAGCDLYAARLGGIAAVEVVEVREAKGAPDEAREKEGAALLAAADGHVVALDERGRSWRSSALAERIAELELRGSSRLTVLIGGAEGHAPATRERADELWSLSDMTLPHELARLLLLEQLYRAETIRAGHPYHRE